MADPSDPVDQHGSSEGSTGPLGKPPDPREDGDPQDSGKPPSAEGDLPNDITDDDEEQPDGNTG